MTHLSQRKLQDLLHVGAHLQFCSPEMVLKLYGSPFSSYSRFVVAVLLEKEVPFELVIVDMFEKEHKTEEYLKKQPFGQIPCIDDDGFVLYESRAIARYIAMKYADQGARLIPADIKENALFEQAASMELSNFNPPASAAVAENYIKPVCGGVPDKDLFDQHIKNLSAKLDVYDTILSKQKCIAGEDSTLADLFHLPIGAMLAIAGSDIMNSKPNVARWFRDISSRPSWIDAQEINDPAGEWRS